MHFGVWAPFAESIAVAGDFNEWSHDSHLLQKDSSGCWYGMVSDAQVGQEYKFIIKNGDKTLERNDPRALQLTASGDATVIVDDASYEWHDAEFTIPAPSQRIVYEMHIGTFNRTDPATPGTFKTAAAKLDYLAALGVTVIEIMPVSGTTTDRWWGYDPDYLYAVEASYGGRRAFMEFVDAAHQHGIAVIVDVVYNHLSPFPGLDLWQFDGWSENDRGGIYFYNDERGDTPWGPRLDYGRSEVCEYLSDNAVMWLRDCHVDGLRVDSTHNIHSNAGLDTTGPSLPDGWKVLQQITDRARAIKPDAILIAEDNTTNAMITTPVAAGGAGFNAQWDTSMPYILREVLGVLSDEGRDLGKIVETLTKAYNQDPWQRVVYSESHDMNAGGHARLNNEISPENDEDMFARRRSGLAAVLILTAPGLPMLFQGQEFMESDRFTHWQALEWEKADEFKGIIQLYTDLIGLRRNLHGVSNGLLGGVLTVLCDDATAKVLAYARANEGADDAVVVAINFSNQPIKDFEIQFPAAGSWKARLNSDWSGYSTDYTNTPTPDVDVTETTGTINLGPYSAVIFSR